MTSESRTSARDLRALAETLLPDASVLQTLARRNPRRAFADVAGCYAAILLAFVALAWSNSSIVAALTFVVVGNRLYALSILAHDGKHGNLLDKRWNDVFSMLVLAAPIGIVDFRGERLRHFAHHTHLGTAADPDLSMYTLDGERARSSLARFALGIGAKSVGNALHPVTADPRRRSLVGRLIRDRGAAMVAQVLIFATIAAVFSPWHYVALWAAPIFFLVYVPHKLRMFCEHGQSGLPNDAPVAKRLVRYRPSWIERELIAPMGINYHAEHHLWPFVPYYNLPALHALVDDSPIIDSRRSYLGFAWRYFCALPRVRPTRKSTSTS